MKCCWVYLGLISTILGKACGVPLLFASDQKVVDKKSPKFDLDNQEYSVINENEAKKSLLSEYLVGIAQSEIASSEPSTTTIAPEIVTTPKAKPIKPKIRNRNRLRPKTTTTSPIEPNDSLRQLQPNSAVDNIEDAIIAALETAKNEEKANPTTATPRPRTRRPTARMNSDPVPVLVAGQLQQQLVQQIPIQQQYVVVPINQQGLVNGQLLQLAPVDEETTTVEPAPGEFIAGFFGSLAQANLAGIADNTFKLLASAGVQNFFVGLADQVTCQFSPECSKKQKEKTQGQE